MNAMGNASVSCASHVCRLHVVSSSMVACKAVCETIAMLLHL